MTTARSLFVSLLEPDCEYWWLTFGVA